MRWLIGVPVLALAVGCTSPCKGPVCCGPHGSSGGTVVMAPGHEAGTAVRTSEGPTSSRVVHSTTMIRDGSRSMPAGQPTRTALSLDWTQISVPVPRLVSVPDAQPTVITTTSAASPSPRPHTSMQTHTTVKPTTTPVSQPGGLAVAPAALASQAVTIKPLPAPTITPAEPVVTPAAAAPAPAAAPVEPPAPAVTQTAPAVTPPAPALVPAALPPLQELAPAVTPAPAAPAPPTPEAPLPLYLPENAPAPRPMPTVSPKEVEELRKQLEMMEKQLREQGPTTPETDTPKP